MFAGKARAYPRVKHLKGLANGQILVKTELLPKKCLSLDSILAKKLGQTSVNRTKLVANFQL
jgi:hypothetical protein